MLYVLQDLNIDLPMSRERETEADEVGLQVRK
jgi:hypothetical protein